LLGAIITLLATHAANTGCLGQSGATVRYSYVGGTPGRTHGPLNAAAASAAWVMPMVRPANLTTMQLLDANPGLTAAEMRSLMQVHQELFCR
jgi:hypothetical protein